MLAWTNRECQGSSVCLLRNNDGWSRRLRHAFKRRLLWPLAIGSLLVVGARAGAQELSDRAFPVAPPPEPEVILDGDDEGHFEVISASTELRGGVYFLDASISYRLSSEAREALQSGVPLTIRIDVELLHGRRWWFDNETATLRQLYQLEYHALSERYIVTNLNSGDQDSFPALFSALNVLGRVDRLPLIDASVLDPDRDYELRLRAVLDVEQFPGPLRLLAFWRRDWSLGSEWYRWPLQSD
jgi:hypothetical protein